MNDPALERRLESCKQLMQAWHAFHGYLTGCMKGTKFDNRAEAEFLQLKSQIALLHDAFLESVDSKEREVAATSQSIITIVERCILLRTMLKMTPAEFNKMEMEWHKAYLLVNETIGILEEKIAKLATEGATHHYLDLYGLRNIKRAWGFLTGKAFVAAVVTLVLLVGLVVLPLLHVYSYNDLDKVQSLRAPYRTVRNILRSAFPSLIYFDWEDYTRCNYKKDEDLKFNKGQKDESRFKEFVDMMTSNGTLANVDKSMPDGKPDLQRHVRDNPYDTFVVMFTDVESAKEAMKILEQRRQAFSQDGVPGFDRKYQMGRSANVVAIASAANINNSPFVPDALKLVFQSH